MRGKFISIEGGEGVGKSLLASGLARVLDKYGISSIVTREPGGTPTSNRLRDIFVSPPKDDPLLIETEFCIISAARAQHVGKKILPLLEQGQWVICDRFSDSSRVYQGKIGGIDKNFIEQVISHTTQGLEPDITFLLDCDVDISLSRVEQRFKLSSTDMSRYDLAERSFHQKLQAAYRELVEDFPDRVVLIDASDTIEQVVEKSFKILKDKFNLGL